ncbi:MAG: 23S rRNA (adenine(2503)-C(2))-methyltransferase RlmN [Candidatus Syntrophonatronum acetioxidans]|uniref:Probable dual-specificity RNA methyltransferase RlmN n=1 Tax=Candidatus Syntrophonatronum acetioxidans TaxID=1795816 RepID=A0A424YHU2_9FIRM|nr:MAG: 23S rRNA (adenine(2503)-C(2))-methyltransferase RlmN [Candidatus Syntrophonatronum acetioxidans]
MSHKKNLLGLKEKELDDFFSELGEAKYRAHQLMDWVYKKDVFSFDEMTNFPLALREKLKKIACLQGLRLVARETSREDNVTKYLFELEDFERIEGVVMEYSYGFTACISSQVGCRMSCNFCASGKGGLVRNLEPGEIMAQVLFLRKELEEDGKSLAGVVLMGMGEPLDNYQAVIDFLDLLSCPRALNMSLRHVTLSTCGIAPKIRELARLKLPLTLSVSLNAPVNSLRDKIMPINRRYSLEELLEACKVYEKETGSRITFDYILIGNLNSKKVYANMLANLIKNIKCHVNLIPFNPVKDLDYKSPSQEQVDIFKRILEKEGIPVTVRRTLGRDINAACGQLRRRKTPVKGGAKNASKRQN